jgi:drug/metabolite transporter (DMT)-like permease
MSTTVRATAIPTTALVQLVLAVLLLGASWPVTKIALLDGASPAWFAFGRAFLSMLVSIVVVGASRGIRLPSRVDLPALLSLGLLQLAGYFALAHAAVEWVPAGRTAILSNATLVWTVPIALVLTHEVISARRWIATGLGAAGVIALIGPWAIDWTSGRTLLGNAFLLGAALCWAMTMAIVRRWPPRQSMFTLLPWAFGIAAIALFPMAAVHGLGTWSPTALTCMGLIGLVMAPIGTWCVMQATTALPLIVASVGFLAGPAVGLIISVMFLGEPLTASIVLGALLILGGAAMAASSARP